MRRALTLLATVVGILGTGQVHAGPVSVFINEIHYDNTGTDTGEAIEIAGPAGTNLAGWSIVLYNGANGLLYDTTALSGVIPNQQNGFGTLTLSYAVNGIQNGAPDGIALVDGSASVVQFLSYEGAFTALDGVASGMTSTDIGVAESGSVPVGQSLQLAGTGSSYEDFAWSTAGPNTFGAVNTAQAFLTSLTSLVINEVDYDQAGTDTAEFIELFNRGSTPLDLSAFRLELINGTGGGATVYDTIPLAGSTLAPGGYFVVCANAATVFHCDLDDGPDTNFIQNGAPDAIGLRTTGSLLVDALSYEGDAGAPYTEGSGAGLVDDPSIAFYGLSRFPDGLDTNVNNVDFGGRCITPGFSNSSIASNCPDPAALGSVPEPATFALLGIGFAALGVARRNRVNAGQGNVRRMKNSNSAGGIQDFIRGTQVASVPNG